MFEELGAHEDKEMALEGSLECGSKTYFSFESISLSVEELEREEGHYQ